MFNTANKASFCIKIKNITNNKLQVLSFDGVEGINTEYAFEVTLVSNHLRYDVTQLLSENVYLSFSEDGDCGVHGEITAVKRCAVGRDYTLFKIIIRPRFSRLHHRLNQKVFVNKSVPEIISHVLNEHGFQEGIDFKLSFKEAYLKRELCCQYHETDADFIYRLCEEEGINIYYQHGLDNHLMVFCDANSFFLNHEQPFIYAEEMGGLADCPVFKRFDINLSTTAVNASFRNYNFKTMKIPEGFASNSLHEKANQAVEPKLEYYDYPQHHLDKERGDHYAKIEAERLKAEHILADAYTDIPILHSGTCFTMDNYPVLDTLDTKGKWLIIQIYHQGRQPQVLESLSSEMAAMQAPHYLFKHYGAALHEELYFPLGDFSQGYRNVLVSAPYEVTYRPKRWHPKPRVLGTQTAVVTGAIGEEVYCDEYGRVKILFHWDRLSAADEHSSCWVRVASSWAHDGYGAVVIPRVGMEVKVDFLEGDIDSPIITGALHNGVNKVPYSLPENKTKSVFRTSSSKGGNGCNEFRIEDKAGSEQIFVQAQKDYDLLVKNNAVVEVDNNSHLQVGNEYSETIVSNHYMKIGGEEHHLTDLDRKTQILGSDYKQVALSEHKTVGMVSTMQAGQEIHLKAAGQIVIDGGLSLTLKAGGQHIVLNPAGIWMTIPTFPGGVPMEGVPAISNPPLHKVNGVTPVTAPAITPAPFNKIYSKESNALVDKPKYNLRFQLTDDDLVPYSYKEYIAYLPNGETTKGITDKDGFTETFYDDKERTEIKVHILLDNKADV